jgi:hypothetical protein
MGMRLHFVFVLALLAACGSDPEVVSLEGGQLDDAAGDHSDAGAD